MNNSVLLCSFHQPLLSKVPMLPAVTQQWNFLTYHRAYHMPNTHKPKPVFGLHEFYHQIEKDYDIDYYQSILVNRSSAGIDSVIH